MSIEKVDSNMQKGLAIIVGNNPDGILLHIANVLGNRIDILKKAKINCEKESDEVDNKSEEGDSKKLIYLIGHGGYEIKTIEIGKVKISIERRTIDGKSLKYVAKKLQKAGYDGSQTLYPIICHYEKLHKDLEAYLNMELSSKKGTANIVNKSKEIAIFIENNGLGELYSGVKDNTKVERKIQKRFIKGYKLEYDKLSELKLTTSQMKLIQSFKEFLIKIFDLDI